MPLRDAKDLIYGLYGVTGNRLTTDHGGKGIQKRLLEMLRLAEESFGALWVGVRKRQELAAALCGDDSSQQQKAQQILPGESKWRAQFVAEIDGEAAANKARVGGRFRHRRPSERGAMCVGLGIA